ELKLLRIRIPVAADHRQDADEGVRRNGIRRERRDDSDVELAVCESQMHERLLFHCLSEESVHRIGLSARMKAAERRHAKEQMLAVRTDCAIRSQIEPRIEDVAAQ